MINTNKTVKIIIILSAIAGIVAIILYFIFRTPALAVKKFPINNREFQNQMDAVKDAGNSIKFITFRGTAVAELKNGGQNFSLLSEQVLPGEIIEDYSWNKKLDYITLKLTNDKFILTDYETYKDNGQPSIYALYKIGDSNLTFYPEYRKLWFYNDILLSIDKSNTINQYIKVDATQNTAYIGGSFLQTKIKSSSENIVISKGNGAFGVLNNKEVTPYNESLEKKEAVKLKEGVKERIRFFDNGYVAELTKNNDLFVYNGQKTIFKKNMPNTENLLFGENIFIFTEKDNLFAYMPLKNKKYLLQNLPAPKTITFLSIFGLSEKSAFYPDEKSNNIYMWKF